MRLMARQTLREAAGAALAQAGFESDPRLRGAARRTLDRMMEFLKSPVGAKPWIRIGNRQVLSPDAFAPSIYALQMLAHMPLFRSEHYEGMELLYRWLTRPLPRQEQMQVVGKKIVPVPLLVMGDRLPHRNAVEDDVPAALGWIELMARMGFLRRNENWSKMYERFVDDCGRDGVWHPHKGLAMPRSSNAVGLVVVSARAVSCGRRALGRRDVPHRPDRALERPADRLDLSTRLPPDQWFPAGRADITAAPADARRAVWRLRVLESGRRERHSRVAAPRLGNLGVPLAAQHCGARRSGISGACAGPSGTRAFRRSARRRGATRSRRSPTTSRPSWMSSGWSAPPSSRSRWAAGSQLELARRHRVTRLALFAPVGFGDVLVDAELATVPARNSGRDRAARAARSWSKSSSAACTERSAGSPNGTSTNTGRRRSSRPSCRRRCRCCASSTGDRFTAGDARRNRSFRRWSCSARSTAPCDP